MLAEDNEYKALHSFQVIGDDLNKYNLKKL